MSYVGFIAGRVKQHGQGFRRGDFLQHFTIANIDHQHFRLFAVGDKGPVTGGIEAQVEVEVLFAVILQFLTRQDFIAGAVDGHQFAVGVSGVDTVRFRVHRQARRHRAGIGNSVFQRQLVAVHHPDHALFTQTGDVDSIGFLVNRQFARGQRAHGFAALTGIEHQTPFHLPGFGINCRYAAVGGIAKPQGLGSVVDRCAERF